VIGDLEVETALETGIGVGKTQRFHAFYDEVEDEINLGGQIAGYFSYGLGGSVDIQIPVPDFIFGGPVDDGGDDSSGGGSGPGSGPILNTIVTGCPTVFIGG
jgi:hypothetical protein